MNLQIGERVGSHEDLENNGGDFAEIEETTSTSHRNTVYEGLRQRDAWLRKAWGRTSGVVAEYQ